MVGEPNTSEVSGGYLQPLPNANLKYDQALDAFLQAYFVALTGLPGQMVRPRLQVEPPNNVSITTTWMGFGVLTVEREQYGAVVHKSSSNGGKGSDVLLRQERLEILVSTYGPEAYSVAALLADNLYIDQNREPLQLAGFGLEEVGDILIVPTQINNQWVPRRDMTVALVRRVEREYLVRNLLALTGALKSASEDGRVFVNTLR